MSGQIKLQQPVVNGSLRSTNFFNGRLVTGADMTREQAARREAVWRTGKAAGEGIARVARELLAGENGYGSGLRSKEPEEITSHDVFDALALGDPIARRVIDQCVELWGMAAANLVSIFNPEKIIFGGGVFGPATTLIPEIRQEAAKWAQPIAIRQVAFEPSALGSDAGLYGAGLLALRNSAG